MKAILLAAALLLAAPSDWRLVATTKTDRFYLQSRVVLAEAPRVRIWEKAITRTDTPEGREDRAETIKGLSEEIERSKAEGFTHRLYLREFDCERETGRFLQILYYANTDNILARTQEQIHADHNDEWHGVAPDTAEEQIFKRACLMAELKPGEVH